jgi:hypothetical protein
MPSSPVATARFPEAMGEQARKHCNQTCKDQSEDEFYQPLSVNRSRPARQKEFSSTSNRR